MKYILLSIMMLGALITNAQSGKYEAAMKNSGPF